MYYSDQYQLYLVATMELCRENNNIDIVKLLIVNHHCYKKTSLIKSYINIILYINLINISFTQYSNYGHVSRE